MQQEETTHRSSLIFILFAGPDENPDSNIEEHIGACTSCQEVLKRVLTTAGRRMLQYLHPTSEEIFMYVYPESDFEEKLGDEDRRAIEHHLSICRSCKDRHQCYLRLVGLFN